MTDKEKIETANKMYGSWHWSGKEVSKSSAVEKVFNVQRQVKITKEALTVHKGVENVFGGTTPISSSSHWFDDYLIFIEEQKYFVRYADDEVLVFGEMRNNMSTDDVKWECRFERMV